MLYSNISSFKFLPKSRPMILVFCFEAHNFLGAWKIFTLYLQIMWPWVRFWECRLWLQMGFPWHLSILSKKEAVVFDERNLDFFFHFSGDFPWGPNSVICANPRVYSSVLGAAWYSGLCILLLIMKHPERFIHSEIVIYRIHRFRDYKPEGHGDSEIIILCGV